MIYDIDTGFVLDSPRDAIQILKGYLKDNEFHIIDDGKDRIIKGVNKGLYFDEKQNKIFTYYNGEYTEITTMINNGKVINLNDLKDGIEMGKDTSIEDLYDISDMDNLKEEIAYNTGDILWLSISSMATFHGITHVISNMASFAYIFLIIYSIYRIIRFHTLFNHGVLIIVLSTIAMIYLVGTIDNEETKIIRKINNLNFQEAKYLYYVYCKNNNMEDWEIETGYKNTIKPFVNAVVADRLEQYKTIHDKDDEN